MPAEQIPNPKEVMDVLTFIAEMTKALAWPVVAGAVAFYIRKPLFKLIVVTTSRLRLVNKAKIGGVELAIEALAPAVVNAEIKAEEAKERLEHADTAEDRKKLAAELARASTELANLQAAQLALQPRPPYGSFMVRSTRDAIAGLSGLKWIVSCLGRERILFENEESLNRSIKTIGLDKVMVDVLTRNGVLQNGELTHFGLAELRAYVMKIQNEIPPASPPSPSSSTP